MPHADRGREPGGGHGAADVALEPAAAHRAEQPPVERRHLDQPLHAGGAVRQDGLGARLGDDGLPAGGDVGQRLVPAHALEPALALRPDALQRVQHAVRVVDALEVVVHLGAERAARERMRGIAGQPLGGAVPDLDHPAAGVRAVVPAGAADGVERMNGRRHGSSSRRRERAIGGTVTRHGPTTYDTRASGAGVGPDSMGSMEPPAMPGAHVDAAAEAGALAGVSARTTPTRGEDHVRRPGAPGP